MAVKCILENIIDLNAEKWFCKSSNAASISAKKGIHTKKSEKTDKNDGV